MKPLLTIPLQASELKEIDHQLRLQVPGARAYEIWLDQMNKKYQKPEIIVEAMKTWRKLTGKKLVIVCKSPDEKGKFSKTDRQKVDLLLAAAHNGAHFVDLGFRTHKHQIERLRVGKRRASLILSFHDFVRTPSLNRLKTIAKQLQTLGADVVKIATMVGSPQDNETLIQLALELKKNKQPHIIIGMGQKGILTRVFARHLGNELNFVTLGTLTAPGQLSLEQMLRFQKVFHHSYGKNTPE